MNKVSFWLSFKIPKCIHVMENKVLPVIKRKREKKKKKKQGKKASKDQNWITGLTRDDSLRVSY